MGDFSFGLILKLTHRDMLSDIFLIFDGLKTIDKVSSILIHGKRNINVFSLPVMVNCDSSKNKSRAHMIVAYWKLAKLCLFFHVAYADASQ
jgi:hypothetical protein